MQQPQQPPQQQQQQQHLTRPEDGELLGVVTKLESLLDQSTNKQKKPKDLFEELCRIEKEEESSNSSGVLQKEQKVQAHLESVLPPAFLQTVRDHFSQEKLRLSDEAALAAKEEGNKVFQAQRFDDAVLCFTKAMLSAKSDHVLAVLLGNRSAAFLSSGMTLASALDTTAALALLVSSSNDSSSEQSSSRELCVKLLDRRARCLAALGFDKESADDVAAAKAVSSSLSSADEQKEKKEKETAQQQVDLTKIIPDPSAVVLKAKQSKVTDDWIFSSQEGQQADGSSATIHKSLRCSVDKQPLPETADKFSLRRYASLVVTDSKKEEKNKKNDDEVDDVEEEDDDQDMLSELPAAAAVRTDALLVVCAQCFQRSSTLYPSEHARAAGFRCRGMFCSTRCENLYWRENGQDEVGIPLYMAASAETVCCLRLVRSFFPAATNDEKNNQQQPSKPPALVNLSFSSREKEKQRDVVAETLFGGLSGNSSTTGAAGGDSTLKPKCTSSSQWLVKENLFDMHPRTKETDGDSVAAFGGHESSLAIIMYVLRLFKTVDEANNFIQVYRRVISLLQHVTFVDRVFQSKSGGGGGGGGAGAAAVGDTHATVSVCCAIAYYPLATTLFNHSCDPNCHITWKGNPFSSSAQLHVRLLKKGRSSSSSPSGSSSSSLQEGEMLTVSWCGVNKNTNHSTRSRLQVLRKLFGFSCCCNACASTPDEPISREKQEMMIKAADYYQKGRRLIRERRDLPEAIAVLKQSLEILFKYVCPPPEPPIFVVAKTFDAIAQASVLLGDHASCLEFVKKRLDVLEVLHNEMSFEYVMEVEKLAALLKSTNQNSSELAKVEEKAKRIFKTMYPPSVSLNAELDLLTSSQRRVVDRM